MSVKKNYTAEEKAKIALEALKENLTFNEISSKYQVHSTQISKWKKIARDGMIAGFKDATKKNNTKDESEELIEELYKQIGQLKVELDWLKKKSKLFFGK